MSTFLLILFALAALTGNALYWGIKP